MKVETETRDEVPRTTPSVHDAVVSSVPIRIQFAAAIGEVLASRWDDEQRNVQRRETNA